MKKFKPFFNLEKEEKWLNKMLQQGWALSRKPFSYEFVKMNDKNGIIKIDYRTFKSKKDWEDYILLFQDSGWKHIVGDRSSGKQYFIQADKNASADIFSDQLSRAERYKRMANVWISLAASYLILAFALYQTNTIDIESVLNPRSFYLTPGLWEMTGSSFWKAFLFETPFALGRGFAWLIFPILVVLYIVFAIKARMEYKKIASNNSLGDR